MDIIDPTPVGSPTPPSTSFPPNSKLNLPAPSVLRGAPVATSPLAIDAQFTHESKLPPLSLDPPKARLARGPALAALAGIGSAVAIATAFAFSPSPKKPVDTQPNPTSPPSLVRLPDVIQDQKPSVPVSLSGSPDAPSRSPAARPPASPPTEAAQQATALRRAREEALHDELEKALASPLYANVEDPFAADQRSPSVETPIQSPLPIDRSVNSQLTASGSGSSLSNMPADPNLQAHKNDFLAHTEASLSDVLIHPRSPYALQAGTIIPTVLITGLDSDLPGNILGQVSENVYDTVTGNYLLIPQGSKLIAKYDSIVSYGQERVLVCWQRIIRPDGTSISLDCMPGIDKSGYAGFTDEVDHHWWRVLTGIALGSVLAAGIQAPQGNVTGYVPTIGQAMAGNAAGAVNQAGQQITTKALNIQPTIKIRPGFSVSVFVTKDLVLEPYSLQP